MQFAQMRWLRMRMMQGNSGVGVQSRIYHRLVQSNKSTRKQCGSAAAQIFVICVRLSTSIASTCAAALSLLLTCSLCQVIRYIRFSFTLTHVLLMFLCSSYVEIIQYETERRTASREAPSG